MHGLIKLPGAWLIVFCFANTALADDKHQPIGDAINNVPIFDAHIHYKEPAWEVYSPENIIELMDRNGVAMGLVSSTPDEGTIRLWKHAPGRIVPELRPYYGNAGSANWTRVEGMAEYIEQRLDQYPHEGIGEFHIHRVNPKDIALLKKVTSLAKKHNILIHIHSAVEPVRLLYRLEPTLTVIWAHVGMSTTTGEINELMADFPTLYADTSFREDEILRPDGKLDPEWRKILINYSDRIMVGTDTWINDQWHNYDYLIKLNRQWLSQLPREIAENLAYKNAARLFKREISMDLIGTR